MASGNASVYSTMRPISFENLPNAHYIGARGLDRISVTTQSDRMALARLIAKSEELTSAGKGSLIAGYVTTPKKENILVLKPHAIPIFEQLASPEQQKQIFVQRYFPSEISYVVVGNGKEVPIKPGQREKFATFIAESYGSAIRGEGSFWHAQGTNPESGQGYLELTEIGAIEFARAMGKSVERPKKSIRKISQEGSDVAGLYYHHGDHIGTLVQSSDHSVPIVAAQNTFGSMEASVTDRKVTDEQIFSGRSSFDSNIPLDKLLLSMQLHGNK